MLWPKDLYDVSNFRLYYTSMWKHVEITLNFTFLSIMCSKIIVRDLTVADLSKYTEMNYRCCHF